MTALSVDVALRESNYFAQPSPHWSVAIRWTAAILSIVCCCWTIGVGSEPIESTMPHSVGCTEITPSSVELSIPAPYRVKAATFTYDLFKTPEVLEEVCEYSLTFRSPMGVDDSPNALVHCDLFNPRNGEARSAVIVLHALDGSLPATRMICRKLACNGLQVLLVVLPYYGPRADAGQERQMITTNVHATATNIVQAVLDVRYAATWLRSQPGAQGTDIGILGISLGGIVGALSAEMEPRIDRVCLILAGGDFGPLLWTHPSAEPVRKQWLENGGTMQSFLQIASAVDPVTHGHLLSGRRTLMMNAQFDEVIPRQSADALRAALGNPAQVWWPCGHATAIAFAPDAIERASRFFLERRKVR